HAETRAGDPSSPAASEYATASTPAVRDFAPILPEGTSPRCIEAVARTSNFAIGGSPCSSSSPSGYVFTAHEVITEYVPALHYKFHTFEFRDIIRGIAGDGNEI